MEKSLKGQWCPLKGIACQEECARCDIYKSGRYNLTLRNRPHPGIYTSDSADIVILKNDALRYISLFFISVPVTILGELARGAWLQITNAESDKEVRW